MKDPIIDKQLPLFIPHPSISTAVNKTGSWRFFHPKYEEKTAPCSASCPVGQDIPRIELLASRGTLKDAWQTILAENPFPAVCGRVCFHPCESACNRALGPGWNIWTDQTDSLAQRDTGWIQLYCEDGQEALDIGFQSLSGAVERNEDCIFVCYNNEAYMNTGVQRSSATPYGTQTTTTPADKWKKTGKKNIMEALAAHRIPYAATASIGYPEDMMRKFKKAGEMKGGSRFIHVLATCPTGWRIGSEMSVKIARLAVQTNVFPLYEVEGGIHYTLNYKGDQSIKSYFTSQGRFKHLTDADINLIQQQVDAEWDLLLKKENRSS